MAGMSTLRRTEAEVRLMEQKKAELEITPPIDFWDAPDEEEEDSDKYECQKDQDDLHP